MHIVALGQAQPEADPGIHESHTKHPRSRLGDVARVTYGKARPKTSGPVPVIGSGGVFGTTAQPLIDSETIVIGRKGSAGSVYYAAEPCYPTDTTFYLNWTQEVSVPYVYFALLHAGLSPDRSVIPSLGRSDVEYLTIPLPPLPEQRAIAHVLRTVQEAIQARRREADLERERKAALMQHLFTKGTRGEATKQTEIGEMPESWQVSRLEEVSVCLDRMRVPVNSTERNTRLGNIPYYGASGQAGWINDYLFDEPLLLVAEDGENLESRKLPIAYSIQGKSWVNNHAHVLRVSGAHQTFLEYFLNWCDITQYLSGATRPKLNQAQLNALLVPLPNTEDQTLIAEILRGCDSKLACLAREESSLQELFDALLEELMTGRLSALPLVEGAGGKEEVGA